MNEYKILKNYLLYFLTFILICIVGITGVFADTYINIDYTSDISVVLVSTAYGNSPFTSPKGSEYNFEQVTAIDINVDNYNFEANKQYQLELNLTMQQLTNANKYSVTGANGDQCLISYDIDKTHFNGAYPRWVFQCSSATNHINLSITNSNGSYLWNGSGIFKWVYTYLRYSTSSLSSTGNNTDDIINNQNQNTQDIINNQNQNTQDIIDNQNANTDKEIESQKVCFDTIYNNYNNLKISGYLNSIGVVTSSSLWKTSDYVKIDTNSILSSTSGTSGVYLCFYSDDYTRISCTSVSNNGNDNYVIPSNTVYFRYSLRSSNSPTYIVNSCKNGNQVLNDSLTDDDTFGATNEASDFFSSFNTNTFGLTSIITAPLNLIQSLTSSSCTPLHLPLPYLNNKYLDLPCMTTIYSQYFGSFFILYQTITYGIIAYWVCVRVFNLVKDFKNPEHDEIEVIDL